MVLKNIIKKILSIFAPQEKQEIEKNIDTDAQVTLSFLNNPKLIELKKEVKNNINYNIINIDPEKLDEQHIKQLSKIYPELRENGALFLKDENYKFFKEYREDSKDIPILKFFKGKLDEQDFQALRIAVFIKKKTDENKDIKEHLEQLYRKFGSRGGNINNLYGEGYFDNFIKPYYNLLQSENRIEEFKKNFDIFVTDLPITYFVNSYKSQEIVNQDLLNKIKKSKKYGIKRLNIHGIGSNNTKKIKEFLDLIKDRDDLKISFRNELETRMSVSLEICN